MGLENAEHAYSEYTVSLPAGERFSQHHLKVRPADLSRYVLIPGSHLRGRRIAERLEGGRVVSSTRGYYVYSGRYKGEFVSVCSTGIGGPSLAIAMEELGRLGADTFVRPGSAGTRRDDLGVGDVVVATGACRFGGTSSNYLPPEFPAVADFGLTRALVDAADRLRISVHVGLCTAGDAFYAPKDPTRLGLLVKAGVLAMEMEADTEFILGAYHGWRCAAAFVLDGGKARTIHDASSADLPIASHSSDPDFVRGEDELITLCLEALSAVSRGDIARG
ncbi:MAG: nucleoside phosphorylase [Chloroflexota bacterium]